MYLKSNLNFLSIKRLTYFTFIFLFIACGKKEGADPQPQASLASNLVYSPASLNLIAGASGISAKPAISGTMPVTYSITTSPLSNGAITIDSEGKINAAITLAVGTYKVSVTAVNAAGSAKFDDVYTIIVTAAPTTGPANLIYTPNSLTLTQGTAATSAVPSITSTGPVTYTFSVSPATTAITINSQGRISASTALTTGTYLISVTAENASGSKTFANIYSFQVNSVNTLSVTYNGNIKSIIQNSCGSCHISGPQTGFGTFISAKNNIDVILSRIKLPQGSSGMMPSGGSRLSQATIDLVQKWKDDGLLEN
ncbi:MAG: hypothetical protein H7Y07_12615 [Pyrinomonadaceae bacterium]|nr:hypothetical protein [Sphingobacteriaceae bacterium]